MIQANTKEQLLALFEIFKDNPYVGVVSITAVLSLIILLLANRFKNKKITKILCAVVYFGIFGTLLYFYHTEIFKLLDYLMNNIFLFLFFPNLAVYVLVLIIINIIIIKSTFSSYESKLTKNTNIIFFILFSIIFYLIIDNVIKNKINVYEQLSIYTNNDLLILVELSMKLFLCWLIILLIIKITSNLISKIAFKKSVNRNLNLDLVINPDELQNIQTAYDVSEIYPTNIKEEVLEIKNPSVLENKYNIYNDYLDVEPIKKQKVKLIETKEEEITTSNLLKEKVEEVREVSIQDENKILFDEIGNDEITTEDVKPIVENKEEYLLNSGYQGESFSSFNIVEPNFSNNYFKDYNNSLKIEEVNNFNLESKNNNLVLENEIVDDFYDYNYKEELKNQTNMDLIFNTNNSYLKNIVVDIEKLKDNQNDKNQIQKIYEEIKLNQKDLTLKDYNYLIDMLLTVKK